MPTICFFPWLTLRDDVRVMGFELSRYDRGIAPLGRGTPEQAIADLLLEPYRHVPKVPIRSATLLRLDGKSAIDHLDDAEADEALRYGEMVAFAGLAGRRFFDQFSYVNRDSYRLMVQRFTDPTSGLGVVARRRDGAGMIGVSRGALLVQKPYHICAPAKAPLDVPLLEALVQREKIDGWGDFEEATLGFNAASTDSRTHRDSRLLQNDRANGASHARRRLGGRIGRLE
jgi:hypothetical protein